MGHLMLVGETLIFSLPLEKTLVYAIWYSALFWLPVRLVCALIDRHRAITHFDEPMVIGESSGYRIGMDVEPPM